MYIINFPLSFRIVFNLSRLSIEFDLLNVGVYLIITYSESLMLHILILLVEMALLHIHVVRTAWNIRRMPAAKRSDLQLKCMQKHVRRMHEILERINKNLTGNRNEVACLPTITRSSLFCNQVKKLSARANKSLLLSSSDISVSFIFPAFCASYPKRRE